jgi:hypothetical protein
MCHMLYIASNIELELVPWDENDPGFHVTKLGKNEEGVRLQFKNENVYYAGAYEGCGCGFQAGEYPGYEDEEIDLKLKSLTGLSEYLDAQIKRGSDIELFGCWDGDQSEPAEHQRTVSTETICRKDFWFRDKEYLIVKEKV